MTRDQLLSVFKDSGALLEGHFQLTSGLHSAQYFQCAKVLQYPHYAEQLCGAIAREFRPRAPEVVVAPALGGIVVGQEVGRQLGARTMFTERKDGEMQLRRGFEIRGGESVLVCEDVVTTGGSVNEVIDIVHHLGGTVVGVGYIVDRSDGAVQFAIDDGGKQFALLHLNVVAYDPGACPLCGKGLPIMKPGSRTAHSR
jgi:orotate phosphoribosyltransferase